MEHIPRHLQQRTSLHCMGNMQRRRQPRRNPRRSVHTQHFLLVQRIPHCIACTSLRHVVLPSQRCRLLLCCYHYTRGQQGMQRTGGSTIVSVPSSRILSTGCTAANCDRRGRSWPSVPQTCIDPAGMPLDVSSSRGHSLWLALPIPTHPACTPTERCTVRRHQHQTTCPVGHRHMFRRYGLRWQCLR